MDFLCSSCKLRCEIEEYREKLNNIIVKKEEDLLDEEVINLSEILDQLLYKCITCRKNLNIVSNLKLNLKDISGTHSTFYYYGEEHLFTNMYFYISQGIKNNEIIYISMQEKLYNNLIDFLESNDLPIKHIKFRAVKELIESNKQDSLISLKEKINDICLEEEVKKYTGVRWIGQPTYAIETTSKDDFLNWEVNLNEALINTKISLICIYDFYDYMYEGKFINEEVISKSLHTHSYILKNLVLKEIKID